MGDLAIVYLELSKVLLTFFCLTSVEGITVLLMCVLSAACKVNWLLKLQRTLAMLSNIGMISKGGNRGMLVRLKELYFNQCPLKCWAVGTRQEPRL